MPAAFQAFQREFGRYLRDPQQVADRIVAAIREDEKDVPSTAFTA